MKLSEAILLGSTVLAPKAGGQHFSESQSGCALGMAAVARGYEFVTSRHLVPASEHEWRTLGTEGVWGRWVLQEVARPCKCWRFSVPREMRIKDVIAHLFDYHVMTRQNWTLERLVAWVESVEPKEVPPPTMPSPAVSRQALRSHFEERRREAEEWQAVSHAFLAKHDSRRRRGPSSR